MGAAAIRWRRRHRTIDSVPMVRHPIAISIPSVVIQPLFRYFQTGSFIMSNRLRPFFLSSAGVLVLIFAFLASSIVTGGQEAPNSSPRPHVLVLAVNGAEWDLLRPLLIRGELPNLQKVIDNGSWGKLS